jgi:DNA repair protein RadC
VQLVVIFVSGNKKTCKMENLTIQKSSCLAEIQVSYKTKVKPSERQKISSSKDCQEILNNVFSEDKIEHVEEFVILCLNRQNKVLGWAKISTGGLTGTVVDPKVVFQIALNANASALILSHNHPSGNLKPSQEDINITKKLQEGAKLLDLQILDHIIMTSEGYFSFGDEGLI